jgi:hypothetical protein
MSATYPLDMVRGRITVQEAGNAQYRGLMHATGIIIRCRPRAGRCGGQCAVRGWGCDPCAVCAVRAAVLRLRACVQTVGVQEVCSPLLCVLVWGPVFQLLVVVMCGGAG